jgi:hypothetical protein
MFFPRFVVAPIQVKLSADLFGELAAHVDATCRDPQRRPYNHQLAGVIRHGEQIEASAAIPNRLKALFCELGRHYIMSLGEANGLSFKPDVQVWFRDSWIVISRAHDYNPVHKHSSQLSGIVYVKVPPQVAIPTTMDGKLHFLFGQQQESNLDLLGNRLVIPKEGDLYLFPAWMQHVVYPFEGPGERVSYAFNLFARNVSA